MSTLSPQGEADDPVFERAIQRLASLLDSARLAGIGEWSAAALATSGLDARPSVRMVDVVQVGAGGILLFAHRLSGKGQQMQANPRAALCFHWPTLHQQVTVDGEVAMLPSAEADLVWNHRPREVGLGHWASDQTAPAEPELGLEQRLHGLKRKFGFERPPRPPDWCAFAILADRIEFWKTGWEHLKSRTRFHKDSSGVWSEDYQNP
ncbi:MAG: pyridoxal 5'-phosphate synthase [Stagnimonas sp.]|nr:pyridoxal 5'-phosphate synthase [Stagnimonas sp.]